MPSHSPPCDIVVLGSLNMDLVMRLPRLPVPGTTTLGGVFAAHPGGKGANQAIQAARLGAATAIVGCVGDDDYGNELREVLLENGVDVEHLHTVPGTTSGIGLIAIDAATGENMIAVASGANLSVDAALAERQSERLRRAKVLLMQSEIPIETNLAAARIAHDAGVLVILNAAPAGDLPDDLLRRVDVLVVNEHEARELAHAPARAPA
ncbi:MAG: ribokinase, partial [Phycisphaerales bacterium]|nr:ribokinase [Phycisphaerales bacterium]